ncbi:MAG TPA: CbiX/SirB N-terminal domain-containing protein [Fodinibius sp.]|nr:CbiX/SirB N-terminal domain-containing protein [Fodinibius sp.]
MFKHLPTTFTMRLIAIFALLMGLATFTASVQSTGVLIMAHGGSEEWNQHVKDAAASLEGQYPVEFAWGMANYVTLQKGINRLEEKGVSEIIAVPLFISSHSLIIRQNSYLFGMRDSQPDRIMPLMHHSEEYIEMTGAEVDSSDYMHGMLMPPNLQQLDINANITMTAALDDHKVVAQILRDRISALSNNPSSETVILAAHGPNKESDNRQWIANLESLSRKIQQQQKAEGKAYKQIFALTVRDDAPEAIYNQAKEHMRAMVRQANQFGDVIVVPVFLSSGGREQAIAERLEGLDFKWSGQTLLPDEKLSNFLVNSVEQAVSEGQKTVEAQ